MNHKKDLKKLAKQAFPSWQYRFHERIKYRKMLYNDMLLYQQQHPDASPETIKQALCDDAGYVQNEISTCDTKKKKMFFLVIFIIIALCAILFLVSSTWEPPTYTISSTANFFFN